MPPSPTPIRPSRSGCATLVITGKRQCGYSYVKKGCSVDLHRTGLDLRRPNLDLCRTSLDLGRHSLDLRCIGRRRRRRGGRARHPRRWRRRGARPAFVSVEKRGPGTSLRAIGEEAGVGHRVSGGEEVGGRWPPRRRRRRGGQAPESVQQRRKRRSLVVRDAREKARGKMRARKGEAGRV